jgi:uncharacterized cupredoxin-like copper-binding protein
MMQNHFQSYAYWPWVSILVVVALAALGWLIVLLARKGDGAGDARGVLDERFARGEIDEDTYRRTRETLGRGRNSNVALIAICVVVLLVASAGAVALAVHRSSDTYRMGPYGRTFPGAYGGTFPPMMGGYVQGGTYNAPACTEPSLTGQVVNVTLADMRGGMMGYGGRMMTITDQPSTVGSGKVSFLVTNTGMMTHELVVLPLPTGGSGTRPVGPDGTVSEKDSLGEASKTCGSGAGEGIEPGTYGWMTLDLPAGRYELVCNLPGHYASGMFAELDVR